MSSLVQPQSILTPAARFGTESDAQRALRAAIDGTRLSIADAHAIIEHIPDDALRAAADTVRARLHPEGAVTYVVDRNINYSNVCTCVCSFCAFYRKKGDADAYVHSTQEIHARIQETIDLGGSGVLMQGGLHPDLGLDWYVDLFRGIKARFPDFYLHCLSPTEIYGLEQVTGLGHTVEGATTILTALRDAGLDSIPGGGGEILVDAIRTRRRSSCGADDWLRISATAHRVGLPTTATMMMGLGETIEMRLEHLDRLRGVQDETGGFIAFIPWTFQPDNTPLGKAIPERIPVDEYLRWLALSRLFLDNIRNLQVSWLTQGRQGGIDGLQSGANDIGSTMIEENVISKAGAHHEANERQLRTMVEEAGFRPALRNAGYRRLADRDVPPAPVGA
ncbi:MAG: CofH family radical SAM protein [Planctomycetes bacterium]|nr:CofH family radical SAM protein [Planctomycetota bacterium]